MILATQSTPTVHAPQVVKPPEKLRIAVHIEAEVLDPEVARRKANVWLLMYAGHLLRADYPELILESGQILMWRYDVVLTSPRGGDIGKIGKIRVLATTGEVLASESLHEELLVNAQALAAHQIQPSTNMVPA